MRYILLVAALVAAALGYTVYWHHVADRISHETAAWITARQQEGYQVSVGGYRVSGFPSQLVLTIDDPTIAKPNDPLAWEWRGRQLILYMQPWNFSRFILDMGKNAHIAWTAGAVRHEAQLSMADAKVSFVLDGKGGPQRADMALHNLSVTLSGLAEPLQAARLELHGRHNHGETADRPDGSVDLSLQAAEVDVPVEPPPPLGSHLSYLEADLSVRPPLPTGLGGLAAWRDQGGVADLTGLNLQWGKLDLRGNGTLTLDKQMRPLAALSTEIRGFDPTITALATAGKVRANDAHLARAVLGMLAKPDAKGDKVLKVPVTAQDGRLFVGPVGLFSLAPLPLPSGQSPAG